tara:strand:- start:1532 stop:2272 length:741 start_codon:yes stop_codon:yes gene_type:complete
MDRLFSVEFAPLILVADPANVGQFIQQPGFTTDYLPVPNTNNVIWFTEQKLDMVGYLKEDLTAFYRNSFEQTGGLESVQWFAQPSDPLKAFDAGIIEMVVVSSVPLTPENLAAAVLNSPGFIPFLTPPGGFEPGNFNREQIIHGSRTLHALDTSMGSDDLSSQGAGYLRIARYEEFSSLEPTAVEYLYAYRVFYFSNAGNKAGQITGYTSAGLGAKRVILSAMLDKEADIPYLMRLKRGYELANQV